MACIFSACHDVCVQFCLKLARKCPSFRFEFEKDYCLQHWGVSSASGSGRMWKKPKTWSNKPPLSHREVETTHLEVYCLRSFQFQVCDYNVLLAPVMPLEILSKELLCTCTMTFTKYLLRQTIMKLNAGEEEPHNQLEGLLEELGRVEVQQNKLRDAVKHNKQIVIHPRPEVDFICTSHLDTTA